MVLYRSSYKPQCVESLLHKNVRQVHTAPLPRYTRVRASGPMHVALTQRTLLQLSVGRTHVGAVTWEGELFTWSLRLGDGGGMDSQVPAPSLSDDEKKKMMEGKKRKKRERKKEKRGGVTKKQERVVWKGGIGTNVVVVCLYLE